MTRSMTGFARCVEDTAFGQLACEIRALNHRHLELSLRLPEELRAAETEFRTAVAARIARGKLELSFFLHRRGSVAPIAIDEALLEQVAEAVHQVARKLGQAAPPDPLAVLRWPGVVTDGETDYTALQEAALKLLPHALDDLVAGREREGARIATVIQQKAGEIAGLVASVRQRAPEIQRRVRERLVARVAEFSAGPEPGRLEQELAIIAQRLDVVEEMDRLDGHLTELDSVLARDEPVGRRLDFLLQEFNREANTLGSKSQDADSTRAAVDLKVLIEQIREQVQNLE